MVEFMISVIVIMFFLFLMLSLSILMVTSEYMEYAAFMAARTYRTGYSTASSQQTRGRAIAQRYVDNVSNLLSNNTANIEMIDGGDAGAPRLNNAIGDQGGGLAGVRISYRIPIFYLPPVFAGTFIDPNITLTTETFLGRDPSAEECSNFFPQFLQRVGANLGGSDPSAVASQMEDNGC